MVRTVLSVVAGVLAGLLLAVTVRLVGDYVFPYPPDVDLTDPESLKTLAGRVPAGAMFVKMFGCALGAFVGTLMAIRISRTGEAWPGWIVAGVTLLFAGWGMTRFPHPIWFMLLTILAVPGAGYAAGWLLLRPHGHPPHAAYE